MRPTLGIVLVLAAFLVPVDPTGSRASPLLGRKTLAPEVFQRLKASQKRVESDRAAQESERIDELDKALESFQRREYEQALIVLQAATKAYPELPPARLMMARLFLAHNQLPLGRAALEQAAVESPAYPGIYNGFGALALAEGRLTDAFLHFDKAASLATSGPWTDRQGAFFLLQSHAGLATVAEGRKDWATAHAALAAWLEREPTNGQARQRLARALLELDKPTEAQAQLQQAVKDDPTLDPAAITMGWLYTHKGNLTKAAEWMQAAVKQAPKDPKVQRGMATWLLQQGKTQEAKTHADAAAKLNPDARELKFLRGLIARYLKDYGQAEDYFQALHQETPGDFQASNQLVLALVEQADKTKQGRALQLAEMNARLYPNAPEALSTLGRVYYRLGRLDEAERALQASVSGGTGSSETAYYLAHVLAERGRLDNVQQLLKVALDAPGPFMFRKEAQEWLERMSKKPQ